MDALFINRKISKAQDERGLPQVGDGCERDNIGRSWVHWAVRRTDPLECLSVS